MRSIREVLRLKVEVHLTNRQIATSCNIGETTVREYVHRARQAGLGWPLPDGLTDDALETLLFPPSVKVGPDGRLGAGAHERPTPDWQHVRKELSRKGVTLRLLWEEHIAEHVNGYRYTQFCEHYTRWRRTQDTSDAVMLQHHKAGEKLFVDYCGPTVPIVDPKSGEITEAQVFVGTLGASSFIYAEATASQGLCDWIGSHVRCFRALGGAPRIVVPDNLKAGVTSPCRYEPAVNPTYQRLAAHYGVAVVPARVRKPKDKPKVENGVQQVERWILAKLRNHTFHSIDELNDAIRPLLTELNARNSKHLGASRQELFEALDKPALRPLPEQPFQEGEWRVARVSLDYHVVVDGHRYSVPYTLIREKLDVHLTPNTVELFHQSARVASHKRSSAKNGATTVAEHMPARHQAMCWQEQEFLEAASRIGPSTRELLRALIEERPVREQAYRACMGILRLGKVHGSERLEAASARALAAHTRSYRVLERMLKNGFEQAPPITSAPAPRPSIVHENLRGGSYYAGTSSTEVGHA